MNPEAPSCSSDWTKFSVKEVCEYIRLNVIDQNHQAALIKFISENEYTGENIEQFDTDNTKPLKLGHRKTLEILFPKVKVPLYDPKSYQLVFYGLEPNGEAKSVDRDTQINKIGEISKTLSYSIGARLDKLPIVSIVSSRGMGKTFLLKKVVLENNTEFIKQARENGRVISVDCGKVFHLLKSEEEVFGKFWPLVIYFHLHCLFQGKRVVVEGQTYDFKCMTYEELLSDNSLFGSKATHLLSAHKFLLLLTNKIWKNNSTSTVFLLDEVNLFANTISTVSWTGVISKHTYLSYLVDQLHILPNAPLCVCAGTTDGDLPLVSSGAHVRVIPVNLSTISMPGVFKLGKDYFENLKLQNGYNFSWPESIEEMIKDHLLISMIYYSFQVPRLLKLAVHEWAQGKAKGIKSFQSILNSFCSTAEIYYHERNNTLKLMNSKDYALLFLSCLVRLKTSNLVPGTNLKWSNLVEQSIVLPYYSEETLEDGTVLQSSSPAAYCIPPVFWISYVHKEKQCPKEWKDMCTMISQIVPGLNSPGDLVVDMSKWQNYSSNCLLFGQLWEMLFANTFVTKYRLISISSGINKLALKDFYEPVETQSQAFQLLRNYSVDLSEGLVCERMTEVTENSQLPSLQKFYWNMEIQNAHHDGVIPASLNTNQHTRIVVQNKYTLQPPGGSIIKPQIPKTGALLWVYPGVDEDSPYAPLAYQTEEVKEAIKDHRLAFLNGGGCINPLTLDLVIILKKLLQTQNLLNNVNYSCE